MRPVLVVDHSQGPRLRSYRWYVLRNPNHLDMAPSTMQTETSCTTSTASHCSSGTQVQPARIRHRSLQQRAVASMRSSFKKPVIMLRQSQTNSSTYKGGTDLAILLNRDTFEPDAAVFVTTEASSSKETRGMATLVDRGLLRRPSLCGTPTVTFCSVHVHNVVAKKRGASTELPPAPLWISEGA